MIPIILVNVIPENTWNEKKKKKNNILILLVILILIRLAGKEYLNNWHVKYTGLCFWFSGTIGKEKNFILLFYMKKERINFFKASFLRKLILKVFEVYLNVVNFKLDSS